LTACAVRRRASLRPEAARMSDRMEEKLRSIGVNADQRKKIMAAAKLGLGPLAKLQGQTDKAAAAPSLPAPAPLPPIRAPLPQAMAAAASQAEERERRRKEAEKREAADEELDDLQGFLAGGKASARTTQRERPAERQRRELTMSSGTAERLAERAVSSSQPAPAVEQSDATTATASAAAAVPGLGSSDADRGRMAIANAEAQATRRRFQEGCSRPSCDGQPIQTEGLLSEEIVMAMLRRARPQSAEPRQLPTAVAQEELEDDRYDANGEDGRIAFLREQRKSAKTKDKKRRKEAKARRAQANERAEEEMDDWDSSEERRKKRRLERPERPSVVQIVQDPAKRNFWGQSVRGVVSGDYKGFSDAALERRFMAQQSSAGAGEKLMSEAEVMALLKQDRSQTRARRR